MYDTVSFAQLDGEHVELLPARTVLSTVSPRIPIGNASGSGSGDDVINSTVSMLGMSAGSHGADGGNADGSDGGFRF